MEFPSYTKEGSRYFDISFPDRDPMPEIPESLIKCVTMHQGEVYGLLRRQGVYEYGGSRLVVKTHKHTKDGSFFQSMEGSGPTTVSMMEIYSLVRQGKLWPKEDWEAPQTVPSRVNLKGPLNSFWMKIRSFFCNLFGKMKTPKLAIRK